MQKKKKICKGCEVEQYIWKSGYCKTCSSKIFKQKPIAKQSDNPKSIKKREEKKEKTKQIHEAMYNFWSKSSKKCQSCGKLLTSYRLYMVDHLLEKSQHPEFALDESNFFLTCFDHHNAKTNGFPHPIHKIAIEKAKIHFNV